MLLFQSLGEPTERKKEKGKKKKKEKGGNKKKEAGKEESCKKEFAEEATQVEEATQAEKAAKKRVDETCSEILWAQARHIDGLAKEAVSLEGEKKRIEDQKKQIEETLAKKWKEAFQLAEATGVSVPHDFQEDRSQKDPFVRHLEESIREKKANLECPVCLEVIDSYFNLSRGSDTFCLVELSLMIKPIFGCDFRISWCRP